jgi:hypothetical protein
VELERPRVDRAVLDFVKATVFAPADFTMLNDGVVRLNLEMVRMVLAKVSPLENLRRRPAGVDE